MIRVIVESPFAADTKEGVERNLDYVCAAMHDCVMRGESPYASHFLLTQRGVLDDKIPEQRRLGIEAGFAWAGVADKVVFYVDRGWSKGMLAARDYHTQCGREYAIRTLGGEWSNA